MEIKNLVMFYLIIFGIVEIIVSSVIFKPIRNFINQKIKNGIILNCAQCLGFWITILVSIYFKIYDIGIILLLAFAGSGVTLLLHSLLMLVVDLSLLIKNKIILSTIDKIV